MERRFLAVTMLIMLLVATSVQALPRALTCAGKCGLMCLKKWFPPLKALCFGLCMVKCIKDPPPKVYNCTRNCAKRHVAHAMASHKSEIGKKRVEHYVESCYEKCNKKEH